MKTVWFDATKLGYRWDAHTYSKYTGPVIGISEELLLKILRTISKYYTLDISTAYIVSFNNNRLTWIEIYFNPLSLSTICTLKKVDVFQNDYNRVKRLLNEVYMA